jgi:hypothetical protein
MVSKRIPSMADPLKCEACGVIAELTKPTDIDASFTELLAAEWMHFARKGIGRERWTWKCPTCKPQGKPQTKGLTTPGPVVSKREPVRHPTRD